MKRVKVFVWKLPIFAGSYISNFNGNKKKVYFEIMDCRTQNKNPAVNWSPLEFWNREIDIFLWTIMRIIECDTLTNSQTQIQPCRCGYKSRRNLWMSSVLTAITLTLNFRLSLFRLENWLFPVNSWDCVVCFFFQKTQWQQSPKNSFSNKTQI